jgi:hypothetical protein
LPMQHRATRVRQRKEIEAFQPEEPLNEESMLTLAGGLCHQAVNLPDGAD